MLEARLTLRPLWGSFLETKDFLFLILWPETGGSLGTLRCLFCYSTVCVWGRAMLGKSKRSRSFPCGYHLGQTPFQGCLYLPGKKPASPSNLAMGPARVACFLEPIPVARGAECSGSCTSLDSPMSLEGVHSPALKHLSRGPGILQKQKHRRN